MKKTWFISHPSGAPDETPTFFHALDVYAADNPEINVLFPPQPPSTFAERLQQIKDCDLVIAEVSIASTGSGIELGVAHTHNKDIIAFHQASGPTSPIIPTVATALHAYISPEDILDVLKLIA